MEEKECHRTTTFLQSYATIFLQCNATTFIKRPRSWTCTFFFCLHCTVMFWPSPFGDGKRSYLFVLSPYSVIFQCLSCWFADLLYWCYVILSSGQSAWCHLKLPVFHKAYRRKILIICVQLMFVFMKWGIGACAFSINLFYPLAVSLPFVLCVLSNEAQTALMYSIKLNWYCRFSVIIISCTIKKTHSSRLHAALKCWINHWLHINILSGCSASKHHIVENYINKLWLTKAGASV